MTDGEGLRPLTTLPKAGDKVLIEFEVDRVVNDLLRVRKGNVEFWMPPVWIEPR